MTNEERILEILKLQSELLLKNTTRLMLIQAALEAHIHEQNESDGLSREDHYKTRQEIFDGDDKESNALLGKLKAAIDRA